MLPDETAYVTVPSPVAANCILNDTSASCPVSGEVVVQVGVPLETNPEIKIAPDPSGLIT